jgi:hypothetical protein
MGLIECAKGSGAGLSNSEVNLASLLVIQVGTTVYNGTTFTSR